MGRWVIVKKVFLAFFAAIGLLAVLGAAVGLLSGDGPLFLGEAVGVVEVKGMIVDSSDTIRQLERFLENDSIKGIVLRVDSPGGVVAPAQEIHEEIRKAVAARKKPVVVSMGSVAASGGYYIAAPATLIFANPGSITGSIGVMAQFTDLQQVMDKVGVKVNIIKTGPYKDTGNPTRAMRRDEEELLGALIGSSYGQFVNAVAEGRKLPVEQVRKIADGRVVTGEQALALKLVDRLGNMQDAVAEAAKLGGISGKPQVVQAKKKRKNFLIELLAEEAATRFRETVGAEPGIELRYEMKLR